MSAPTGPTAGGTVGRGRGRGIGLKSPPAGTKLSASLPMRAEPLVDEPADGGADAVGRPSAAVEAEPQVKQITSPRGFREVTPTAIPSRNDSLMQMPLRSSDPSVPSPRETEASPRSLFGRSATGNDLGARTSPRKSDNGLISGGSNSDFMTRTSPRKGDNGGGGTSGSNSSHSSKGDEGHDEHVAYLEGLVSSLNLRVAEYERHVEQLTAELDEARALLAERPGGTLSRESSATTIRDTPVSPPTLRDSQVATPDSDQQRKRGWVGTVRRTGTVTAATSAPQAGTIAPIPLDPVTRSPTLTSSGTPTSAAPPPALTRSNTMTPMLGGRRREVVDDRSKAVEKLIDGERKYNLKLVLLSTMFIEPMRHALQDASNRHELLYNMFANAEALVAVHKMLLTDLLARFSRWSGQTCIADVLAKYVPVLSVYVEFARSSVGSGPLELGAGPDAQKIRRIIAHAEEKTGEPLAALLSTMRGRVREYVGSCIFVAKATEPTHPDSALLGRVRTDLEEFMQAIARDGSLSTSTGGTNAGVGGSSGNLRSSAVPVPAASGNAGAGGSPVPGGRGPPVNDTSPELSRERSSSTIGKSSGKKSKKGLTSKFGSFQAQKFDRTERTAQEIRAKILADIQERERDPNLTEEERGRLKLQAAFAAQGKFDQALQVMANSNVTASSAPGGGGGIGAGATGSDGSGGGSLRGTQMTEMKETNTAFSEDEAFARLIAPGCDEEFERIFLAMYSYFTSWKALLARLRSAYRGTADSSVRSRVLEVLSRWLEMNPELRHLQAEDGPKKKHAAAAATAAAAAAAAAAPPVAKPLPAPPKPLPPVPPADESPRAKASPRRLVVRKTQVERTPDDADEQIGDMCSQIAESVQEMLEACLAHDDQKALKGARAGTEMTIQLVSVIKSDKADKEPVFLDEGQDLRGLVVTLTQGVIACIKSGYTESTLAELERAIEAVKDKCGEIRMLATAVEMEVEVEEMVPFDDQSSSPPVGESPRRPADEQIGPESSVVSGDASVVYKEAMSFTNAVPAATAVTAATAAAAAAEDERSAVPSEGFLVVLDQFCRELGNSAPEQAFVTFVRAWQHMGTADENQRKNARRKSMMVGRTALEGERYATMDLLRETTAIKVAQQMAILEYRLFQVIPTHELLLCRFMEPAKSPSFATMVTQFNIWGRFAYSEVLRRADVDERVKMIGFFVNVAKESLAMNNFNVSYALVAGLNFPGLSRLKQTWAKVSKRDLGEYEALLAFWNTSRNYKTYRQAIKAAIPPAVPWFGLVAKDLFHLEDASPTFMEDRINFNKLSLVWQGVSFLHTLQKYEFTVKPDATLQKVLSDVRFTVSDEKEAWALSYKYEPKQTTTTN